MGHEDASARCVLPAWLSCGACADRNADGADAEPALPPTQFTSDQAVVFRETKDAEQSDTVTHAAKFNTLPSKNSYGSQGTHERERSRFSSEGSKRSASLRFGTNGLTRNQAHDLTEADLTLSSALADSLGITSTGNASPPPSPDPAKESRAEWSSPHSSSGLMSVLPAGLRKSFSRLAGVQDTDGLLDGAGAAAFAPAQSMGSTGSTNSKGLTFMANLRTRINTFRKGMVAVAEPNAVEVDRGVQIEGVYDYYSFGDRKIRVRKMKDEVYHHRTSLEDVESEDEESSDSSSVSSLSPRSDDDISPEVSPRGTPRSAQRKASAKGGLLRKSPRTDVRKKTSGSDDIVKINSARSVSSRSSDGSTQGDETPRSRRKSTRAKTDAKALQKHTGNPEIFTRWGVLVGVLLHRKPLDFNSVLDKAGQQTSKRKFMAPSQAKKGCILESVRDRARLVAKRAWELAKRISREPQDRFDCEWDEPDLLTQLFSTQYFDTLALFANTTRKILAVQPSLVEASVPCRVFGDIHGQFRDLLLLFLAFGGPDERDAPMFIFNGDFVDRGAHQVEVIGLLMALKVLLPERVWLVRGNHEDRTMNRRYGFEAACNRSMGPKLGPKIFDLMQKAFDMLPVACLIEHRVLVVHGGIGDGAWKVSDICRIQRPLNDEIFMTPWINNLLWSDPIEDDCQVNKGVFGVHTSPRGTETSLFGWSVTKMFCARNGLSLIIRSHQSKRDSPSFDIMHDCLLMRVFSARDYEGHGNDGAVLLVQASETDAAVLKVRPQVVRSTTKAQYEDDCRQGTEAGGTAPRPKRRRGTKKKTKLV